MIINSLSMKNFQCYYGEHADNKLKFKRGINIIIGNNGHGKSKMFDAFYWVIYDQIFQSDQRVFVDTSNYLENLISDKAKRECAVGQSVSAEVILLVTDSQNKKFRITRMFNAKKVSERQWTSEKRSNLIIEQYKEKFQLVPSDRYGPILERVIPQHLRAYMWFQGEQVDSLMDFKSKSALMQTVNLLSDINDYDELIEVAADGENKAARALSKARKDGSKNQNESEMLALEEGRRRKEIGILKEAISQHNTNVNSANDSIELLVGQIKDAKRKVELKEKKRFAENKVHENTGLLDSRLKNLNGRLFSDYWLMKNIEPHSQRFSSFYEQYLSRHKTEVARHQPQTSSLPIDMPRPVHLKDMLEKEECFVCGRSAKEGTEEHRHIRKMLDRDKVDEKNIFRTDCSEFFDRLYTNTLKFGHVVKRIDEKISEEFQEIARLRDDVEESKRVAKDIDRQFDALIQDDRSEDIVEEYKQHNRNRERYQNLKTQEERKLENAEAALQKAVQRQKELVVGGIERSVELKGEVWGHLKKLTVSTRQAVFEKLIAELEDAANEKFQFMTRENNAVIGRLKLSILNNERVVAEIVNSQGDLLAGMNDGNIILMKLALMMAILKSRVLWSQNYSLVSDAPTSKMALEYSKGFYNALGENFAQSIVMTFDFLSVESRKMLADLKVGNVYQLEPSAAIGEQDRDDLSVAINEVSL